MAKNLDPRLVVMAKAVTILALVNDADDLAWLSAQVDRRMEEVAARNPAQEPCKVEAL